MHDKKAVFHLNYIIDVYGQTCSEARDYVQRNETRISAAAEKPRDALYNLEMSLCIKAIKTAQLSLYECMHFLLKFLL